MVPDQFDIDEELKIAFLGEARAHVEKIRKILLDLSFSDTDGRLVAELFRRIHTLKGGASTLHIEKIFRLTHLVEGVLEELRKGSIPIEKPLLNCLRQSVQLIDYALDEVEMDEERIEKIEIDRACDNLSLYKTTMAERFAFNERTLTEGPSWTTNDGSGCLFFENIPHDPAQLEAVRHQLNKTQMPVSRTPRGRSDKPLIVRGRDFSAILNTMTALESDFHAILLKFDETGSQRLPEFENHCTALSNLRVSIQSLRDKNFSELFPRIKKVVEDLALQLRKKIEVHFSGGDTFVHHELLRRMAEPMIQIIRNCCDHGIENPELRIARGKSPVGRIMLQLFDDGDIISLIVSDDGHGAEESELLGKALACGSLSPSEAENITQAEIFDLVFRPGFTTVGQPTEISGRGVGLDIVQDFVRVFGGRASFHTVPGKGSKFTILLPTAGGRLNSFF